MTEQEALNNLVSRIQEADKLAKAADIAKAKLEEGRLALTQEIEYQKEMKEETDKVVAEYEEAHEKAKDAAIVFAKLTTAEGTANDKLAASN